jgi:hypothetical protein
MSEGCINGRIGSGEKGPTDLVGELPVDETIPGKIELY